MTKITLDNAAEYEAHKYAAFASDLEFAVGQDWPQVLETNLGNKQIFSLIGYDQDGTATYRQVLGCITLRVFND